MAYKFKEVTVRMNNSEEGTKMSGQIWNDVVSGKLPILFDTEHRFQQGVSPVSKYSNYSKDQNGDYDYTIMAVTADFFQEMETKVSKGLYKKYDEKDETGKIDVCSKKAWKKVWSEGKSGNINRAFTEDYESTVPGEYTKDGKAHCYLYIAIK
ncbi:AraC family transcriptional regulator [Clostridium botulinum]|uniref:AraC family transcriptional regulator n=1 Tax=Clostridium botulinum TaxID=1491 RepID=UPI0021476102|nr:AraC family transcriptional regulator [Clostridium botulinum]MCR1177771.1 AraC family transcriptional regulator [Clostridium botulinum]